MAQSMQSMNENIERLAIPLPVEAVGVGAKWVVESESLIQSMVIAQRVEATVRSIEGDLVEYYVQVRQSAEGGQVMENVPGQYVNTLESLKGTGSGTVVIDFGHVVPVRSNLVSTNALKFTTALPTGEAMSQHVETTISMSLTLDEKASE